MRTGEEDTIRFDDTVAGMSKKMKESLRITAADRGFCQTCGRRNNVFAYREPSMCRIAKECTQSKRTLYNDTRQLLWVCGEVRREYIVEVRIRLCGGDVSDTVEPFKPAFR